MRPDRLFVMDSRMQGDIHDGNAGHAAARGLPSSQLASGVVLKDGFARPLRVVAGFDAGFEDQDRIARAVAVLVDVATLQPIASAVACLPAPPSGPGLPDVRELPALLAALERLPRRPDLAFVHGHGIAHPRRFGIASQLGVATGLPSIGVADDALAGSGITPHQTRGAYTALRDGRAQLGWLLRSRVDDLPLVVSPGHRVALASAADLVMRFVATDRLPEPLRLARRLLLSHPG